MNEVIEKIKQEILEAETKSPKNEYQDGVNDGYIDGLQFAITLLKLEQEKINAQIISREN